MSSKNGLTFIGRMFTKLALMTKQSCVLMTDYCPENPTCTGDSRTIPDTTAIGEVLFTINGQQGAGSTGDLTYSFVSPTPAYFHVDQSSGKTFR